MIIKRLRSFMEKLINQDHSPERLAITFCLGVYIGISPLIGLHTILTFFCGWFFRLSIPALFAVSIFIHNPWTTIPIYALDHFFGVWLFNLVGIDPMAFEPEWMLSCNEFLMKHTGISGLSLTAFMIGGNLLAIAISVMLYPFMRHFFRSYLASKNIQVSLQNDHIKN